jgi:hypothetical protein
MLRQLSSRKLAASGVGVVGVLVALAIAAVGLAQSGTDDAFEKLHKLTDEGGDSAIVAVVNGVEVPRRAVDVTTASASIQGAAAPSGKPIAGQTPSEVLDGIVENILLAQLAEREGIVVSEDEVSLMISSSITDPLRREYCPRTTKRPFGSR